MPYKRISLITLSLFVLIFAGCTRSLEETSQVSFSVEAPVSSKVSSLTATHVLGYLVINVRGPGIQDVLSYQWDHNNLQGGFGGSVSIDIPAGSNRLIQYLAVYKDTSDGSMDFFYADTTANLGAGQQSITMNGTQFGGSAEITEVVGRYLYADGVTGPTGKINWEFDPLNGKPKLIVQHKEIFGGWFNFVAFDSIYFDYSVDGTGEVLFSSLDASSALLSTSNSILKFKSPSYYKNNGGNCEAEPATNVYFGYFGPGGSNKNVCYEAVSAPAITIYSDATCTTSLTWVPSYGVPGAGQVRPAAGGYASNDGTFGSNCSNPGDFDYFLFDPFFLNDGINDEMIGEGPFHKISSASYNTLDNSFGSSTLTLTWNPLPGIDLGSNAVTGYQVWKKPNGSGPNFDTEIRDPLKSGKMNCQQAAVIGGFDFYVELSVGSTSVAINSLANANDVEVLICPYSGNVTNKKFFSAHLKY